MIYRQQNAILPLNITELSLEKRSRFRNNIFIIQNKGMLYFIGKQELKSRPNAIIWYGRSLRLEIYCPVDFHLFMDVLASCIELYKMFGRQLTRRARQWGVENKQQQHDIKTAVLFLSRGYFVWHKNSILWTSRDNKRRRHNPNDFFE